MKKEQKARSEQPGNEICGNFDMGTCFAEVTCVHGHPVRLFNLHRHHFVACDTCKAYIHVGENLMSSWRRENGDVWEGNQQRISGYQEVVWDTPARASPPSADDEPPRLRTTPDARFFQKVSEILSA